MCLGLLVGREGFEPSLTGPEPAVLPLDDLPRLNRMLRKPRWSVKNGLVVRRRDRYNAPMDDRVRSPIVAGAFYPGHPAALRDQIAGLLAEEGAGNPGPSASSSGLIVPHAGYVYSGSVASAGFREVAQEGAPDVVVILGASHTGFAPWFALPPHAAWETPLGRSPIDRDVVNRLVSAGFRTADAPFAREHSMEVQLPFVQYLWGFNVPIVPICVVPVESHDVRQAAAALAAALHDRRALIVASSDFTHYQPEAMARTLDHRALDRILALDVSGFHELCRAEHLTICGTGAIEILMTLGSDTGLKRTRLVSYATSGDVTGDASSVVGYASVLLAKENHG